MSAEETKIKRSKRIHQKENYIHKQVEIAKSHNIDVKQPHRYLKHAAMDCGVPMCPLCGNARRLRKEKTIQEKRFEQKELYDD